MKAKRLTTTSILPTKAYRSVGYDFYADQDAHLDAFVGGSEWTAYDLQELISKKLMPDGVVPVSIKTGIAIEIPEHHVGLVRDRSGIGIRGVIVVAGVIDPDYRGEIIICLANLNPFPINVPANMKIAQIIVPCVYDEDIVEVSELSTTERGDKGFGSSGGS